MISGKLNKSRQQTLQRDSRHKLLQKRAELLKDIGGMSHDDFVALLEIFDDKLAKISQTAKQKETK